VAQNYVFAQFSLSQTVQISKNYQRPIYILVYSHEVQSDSTTISLNLLICLNASVSVRLWPTFTYGAPFRVPAPLQPWSKTIQESRAIARKPRDTAAVLLFKVRDKFTTSFKSIAKLRKPGFTAPNNTGTKQNLTQNGHSGCFKGHVFWSHWKGDKVLSNAKH